MNVFPLLLPLGLLGCAPAPVPVTVAERHCADRALAQAGGPVVTTGGSVGMGVVAGGGRGARGVSDLSLSLGANISPGGRDPNEAYISCVVRRSGQYPTRPLFDRG